MSNEKRITAATVNAELKRRGIAERITQGRGYVYFRGGDAEGWYTSSVATCYISNQTVAEWIEELDWLRRTEGGRLADPKKAVPANCCFSRRNGFGHHNLDCAAVA